MLHPTEYLIEGVLLGTFMVSACVSVFIVQHPSSPVSRIIPCAFRRRAIIGGMMGLTAIALIYSPWGQRSGAHMNPATTLTFLLLGTIQPLDAGFYIAAQVIGGTIGVLLSSLLLGRAIRDPSVNYVVTTPGHRGVRTAWIAEFFIACAMMTMVLLSTNHTSTAAYTGIFAGSLVFLYITFESPLSGMSINPARTLASAIPARAFKSVWVYLSAPPLGMLCAAVMYVAALGGDRVYCAKLNHSGHSACIFNCHHDDLRSRAADSGIQHTDR